MHNVPQSIIHITGTPVRTSFYEELKNPSSKEKGTVRIMGGGLGLRDITDTLLRLDKVGTIQRFIVVTGQNITVYEEVASILDSLRHPVELHSYTNKVAQLMSQSELIVTKPGALTCTEALTMNLPMVLVNALPGQERANASHLQDSGCAVWVRKGEIAKMVDSLLNNSEKLRCMATACGKEKKDSALEIVHVLDNMLVKN